MLTLGAPFLEGFYELMHERQMGAMGGVGGIPWSARQAWVDRYIDPSVHDLAHDCIRALDSEYLSWTAEEQKKESNRSRVKGRGSFGRVR